MLDNKISSGDYVIFDTSVKSNDSIISEIIKYLIVVDKKSGMVLSTSSSSQSDNPTKKEIIENILKLAEEERKKGNKSITQDKLDNLTKYVAEYKGKTNSSNKFDNKDHRIESETLRTNTTKNNSITNTVPEYSPIFDKFTLPKNSIARSPKRSHIRKKLTFKTVERTFIAILETTANILDNLHLFSKFPMFPQRLLKLLKQTNKLWILILVFLIRKTISQLLNVIRKERKVKVELNILGKNNNSKVFNNLEDEHNIYKKYQKFLKDLKFDKTMLIIELIGNFLDLSFNVIEISGISVPDYFMNSLNFASMFMTIYRMNKDDEYVDDDISEDII